VINKENLESALRKFWISPGPSLLEIRVKQGDVSELSRPDQPLKDLKQLFLSNWN
jgi:hypothetical protein